MKNIIYLFLVFLFTGCSNIEFTYEEMKSDELLSESFTDNELKNLTKIVNFFEEQIYHVTKEYNIENRYNQFMIKDSINFNNHKKRSLINYERQKIFYTTLDSTFFDSFWDLEYFNEDQVINKEHHFYALKSYSKYGAFLKKLSKQNIFFHDYYVHTVMANDFITANPKYTLSYNYDKHDFRDIKVRLLFSLHFLMTNEFYSKKIKYNNSK